jgi:hypothetical protein
MDASLSVLPACPDYRSRSPSAVGHWSPTEDRSIGDAVGHQRILGYGAPITIFVVSDVDRDAAAFDSTDGCALWITNYVTIQAGISPLLGAPVLRVAAHELGHACNLWHLCVDDDVKNLMASQSACTPHR